MPAPRHAFVALLLAFAIAAAPYAKGDVSAGIAKDMADLQEALKDVSADVKDKINTNVLQLLVDTLKAAGADDTAAAIAPPSGGSGSRSGGAPTTSPPRTTLALWAQCGGKGGECQKLGMCIDGAYTTMQCPAGASCKKETEWYYQCQCDNGVSSDGKTCNGATTTPTTPGNTGGSTIPQWEQCGGQGPDGTYGCRAMGSCADAAYPGRSCAAGSSCVRQDNWYWQCKPGSAGGSRSSTATHGSGAAIPQWEQCGGKGPDGTYGCRNIGSCSDAPYTSRSCPAGNTCTRHSEWYWQCMPGGSSNNQPNNNNNNQPNSSGGATLAKWDQCGGRGSECASKGSCVDSTWPGKSCAGGTSCQRQNEYYWQCL